MKCPKCQQEIDDNSKFCNHCGSAIEHTSSLESQETPHERQEMTFWFEKEESSIKPKTPKNNDRRNIGIAVVGLFIVVIVLIMASKNSEDNSTNTNSTAETTEYTEEDYSYDDYSYDDGEEDSFEDSNSGIEVTSFLKCPDFTAEQNSTEMVDQIALTAKENIDDFTSSDAKKIIKKIRKAGHKFYNGPEEMEKYMWYGYLLDYKYDDSDPRSELGTDLTQAIKYVYRDIETVLDSSTKSNLQQIDKDLAKIK